MEIRLNKFIANSGLTSRRKADELIALSKVKVNGKVVKELGAKVSEEDIVEVEGKVIKPIKQKIYLILNKPCCYLTELGSQKDKKNISELLKDLKERVFYAGRLDYNAEGLLILSNDGELVNKIIHPKHQVLKGYLVKLSKEIDQKTLELMKKGTTLEDGFVKPDFIEKRKEFIYIEFHEGRNHLVKRFFLSFDFYVKRLIRVRIGPIYLGDLPKGKWRYLTKKEIESLKKI